MNWYLLNTGLREGSWNMWLDEQLALSVGHRGNAPVLRLFGWRPYTISIGANQLMEDFDGAKIHADGIDIVRRPTGGRAIFHAHELTYSVVLPSGGRGAREIYQYLSRGILAALTALGIPASVAAADERVAPSREDPLAIPCFSVATRSEIQVDGKKIVGNAQRRYGGTILQHGSFLLGPEHRRLSRYLAPHVQSARTAMDDHLLARTTEAETVLQHHVTFDQAADAFREGFRKTYGISFDLVEPEELIDASIQPQPAGTL